MVPVTKYNTTVLCDIDNFNHISCNYHCQHNCLCIEKSSIPTLNRRRHIMCMAHPYPPSGGTPPITSFKPHKEVISTLPQIVMAHPISSHPREASATQSNPDESSFNPNPEVSKPRKDRGLLSYSQPSLPDQFWSSNHGEFLHRKHCETLLQQLPSKNSRKMCSSFNDISISNRKGEPQSQLFSFHFCYL